MFNPRISLAQVPSFADHYMTSMRQVYQEREKNLIENVAPRTRELGFLTKSDFLLLCCWKSPRPKPHYLANSEDEIRLATQRAYSSASERERIESLDSLRGVSYPVASAILHMTHPDTYPILDYRALWTLGIDIAPKYDFDFWLTYTQYFRRLVTEWGIAPRELDRALWQFSRENQR